MCPALVCSLTHCSHRSTLDTAANATAERNLAHDAPVSRTSATLGPYEGLKPCSDAQVGSTYLATRRGANGFEKRAILYCAPRARVREVVAEAKRAARLSHAGIAHVLDVGVHGDLCYAAFEHDDEATLRREVLRRGRLPWEEVRRIGAEVARALAYAHRRRDDAGGLLRIVHRRLSPRRIALDGSGHARITGFGASWAWPNGEEFASPEERRSEPIDGRADVYALGVVMRRCTDPESLPDRASRILERATHALPEHRLTAEALCQALDRDGLT